MAESQKQRSIKSRKLIGVAYLLLGLYLPYELTLYGAVLHNPDTGLWWYPISAIMMAVSHLLNCGWIFWTFYFGLPLISIFLIISGIVTLRAAWLVGDGSLGEFLRRNP